ncbi:MAG: pentapeptide repeat-containing protein [Patescibacteria group bacterium]
MLKRIGELQFQIGLDYTNHEFQKGASHSQIFRGCNFSNCTFSNFNFNRTEFIDCNLENVRFENCSLTRVQFLDLNGSGSILATNCNVFKSNILGLSNESNQIDLVDCYEKSDIPVWDMIDRVT